MFSSRRGPGSSHIRMWNQGHMLLFLLVVLTTHTAKSQERKNFSFRGLYSNKSLRYERREFDELLFVHDVQLLYFICILLQHVPELVAIPTQTLLDQCLNPVSWTLILIQGCIEQTLPLKESMGEQIRTRVLL